MASKRSMNIPPADDFYQPHLYCLEYIKIHIDPRCQTKPSTEIACHHPELANIARRSGEERKAKRAIHAVIPIQRESEHLCKATFVFKEGYLRGKSTYSVQYTTQCVGLHPELMNDKSQPATGIEKYLTLTLKFRLSRQ